MKKRIFPREKKPKKIESKYSFFCLVVLFCLFLILGFFSGQVILNLKIKEIQKREREIKLQEEKIMNKLIYKIKNNSNL